MKILIVNDDGIDAPGILHLAKWAKRFADVTVCAPRVEQSGRSHAINFIEPFEIKHVELCEGVDAYSVDSTPADCTRFGIIGLGRSYDLVLSGINYGVNMSGDIVYSGTVGAIFEAESRGHRAAALSIAKEDPLPEFSVLDSIFEFINKNRLFDASNLYNVNIPPSPKGIKITRQGDAYFSDEFFPIEAGKKNGDDGIYIQRGHAVPDTVPEDLTRDTVAFANGYISVTPMTSCRTDARAFQALTNDE
ncbi:MAG: 5'/3'-nucleotidase SurE [Clostridia bacterium]|nr:5'/3'-nucleotidase SurE [Clostridia bacterium]